VEIKITSQVCFVRAQAAFVFFCIFHRSVNFLKMLLFVSASVEILFALIKCAPDPHLRMHSRNMGHQRSSAKETFSAINTLYFFRWFRRLVNFQNVLISLFIRVKIGWTVSMKVALDGDVFVEYFHVVRMRFWQHFLAVNTLDTVFFVDLGNMDQFFLLGEKKSAAAPVEVALNCFRFVVKADVVPQVTSHFFAENAPF